MENKLIPMTEFVYIKNYENYLISKEGDIIKLPYNNKRGDFIYGKFIKPCISTGGYVKVSLMDKEGNMRSLLLHRLVLSSFTGLQDKQVNHIDGNKINNSLENLEWCTDKENKEHAVKMNLTAKGSKSGKAKLTEADVQIIRQILSNGSLPTKEIAKIFNIDPSSIIDIKNNRTWKHVPLTP